MLVGQVRALLAADDEATRGLSVTRVLIVDDHDFFRGCLVDLVNGSQDLEAVGECTDGAEVASAVRELQPHVVLMDVRMGTVSGIEAVGALQRENATARVIMLTSDTAYSTRAAAEANGAVGYLIKGSDAQLVLDAIRHVARGGTAWPEDEAARSGYSSAS
jgi:DNA-binding NarL/FixJ family response regulator